MFKAINIQYQYIMSLKLQIQDNTGNDSNQAFRQEFEPGKLMKKYDK